MKPKLRSSVSVILLENNIVEFFLTNTRRSVRIKVKNEKIIKLLSTLDGEKSVEELVVKFNLDDDAVDKLYSLLFFLEKKSIITDSKYYLSISDYKKYRRVIHFLGDYATSEEKLLYMWNKITTSKVMIIGLGGIGTWITHTLAQSGVKKFILMDNDKVELSNLHRQLSYFEKDIEIMKVDVVNRNLLNINSHTVIENACDFLTENGIEAYLQDVDLVINCADYPTVDATAKWVGESCMLKGIPHIIAGGYNLHLSLIGPTIIPYESACVKCFEIQLEEMNVIDNSNIKKLAIKNRKIGSFGPLCGLSASMVSMEAFKILSGVIQPSNINRRGEFSIYSMDIEYTNFRKLENCPWCGLKGKYSKYRRDASE